MGGAPRGYCGLGFWPVPADKPENTDKQEWEGRAHHLLDPSPPRLLTSNVDVMWQRKSL